MALINAYCSIGDVRGQLKDGNARLDEPLLERAINASSRAVDTWCSGALGVAAPRRFWRDSSPTARVWAAETPDTVWTMDFATTDGLIVQTDDDDDGIFETTWTIGVDFQVEPLNGGVAAPGDTPAPAAFWRIVAVGTRRQFPVYARRAGVQVTAPYGWSSEPDEVKAATILKSVSLFSRKDAPFGVAGINDFGPVRITRTDPDVIDLLSGLRKTRPRTLTYSAQRYSLFHRTGRW